MNTQQQVAEPMQQREVVAAVQPEPSDWMIIDEVCHYFRLSKNKIKSRQWRQKNNFPCNSRMCDRLIFNRKDVEAWMEANKTC